jgi:REP element-mobilizing transposase RayT
MAKALALEAGHYYHIYNRGNNRENLFREQRNYAHFLRLYVRHVAPVFDTYAYCCLKNHFHVLVRLKPAVEQRPTSAHATASQHLGNLFNAYSKAMNKAYERTGSLFERPFERIEVDSQRYAMQLVS